MEDHQHFVDSMMKQGAKFRNTLKYGFPLEARKTITNEGSKISNSNGSLDKLNQTANVFKSRRMDSAEYTARSIVSKTNRSKGFNQSESPRDKSMTNRSNKKSIKLNLTNQIKKQQSDKDRSNLNFDSEIDLASNSKEDEDEWNSSNESFFFKKIPEIKPEYPACFCNNGVLCPKH